MKLVILNNKAKRDLFKKKFFKNMNVSPIKDMIQEDDIGCMSQVRGHTSNHATCLSEAGVNVAAS